MNHLKWLALGIGAFLVVVGWWCLQAPTHSKRVAVGVPRNVMLGRVLMLIDACWSIWLLNKMEIGFFDGTGLGGFLGIFVKHWWLGGLLVYLFVIFYVDHYLGARSIGLFLILAARPILWICFLRNEPSRLVLVVIAYLCILWGMCIVSAPHWLRDAIAYFEKTPQRWSCAARAKIVLGFVLIGLGLLAY